MQNKLQDVIDRAKAPVTKSDRFLGSLEALAETLDARASIEQLTDAVAIVAKYAKENKQLSEKRIQGLEPAIRQIVKDSRKEVEADRKAVTRLLDDVRREFENKHKKESAILDAVRNEFMRAVELEGKLIKPDVEEVAKLAASKIEIPDAKLGDELIEDINKAEKGQIKRERIEGLDRIEKLANIKASGGGGITGRDIIQKYDLSPSLNGVAREFNIPANWLILSVTASTFPYTFRGGVDYTFTDQTITFTSEINAASSLAAGQTIEIIYVKN